jgi:hypothetical protein
MIIVVMLMNTIQASMNLSKKGSGNDMRSRGRGFRCFRKSVTEKMNAVLQTVIIPVLLISLSKLSNSVERNTYTKTTSIE